jgi:hypothetical protein
LVETFESRMQALVALNALFRTGKSSAATLPTPQQYVASYAKQYKPVRYAIRRTKALTAALKKKLPSGLRR